MIIGVLADLHIDMNDQATETSVIEALVTISKQKKLDALILAGDLANDYQVSLHALNQLKSSLNIPCLFVPGNHDLWNIHHPNMRTWDIYKCLESYSDNLTKSPFSLSDNWVVIGDIGWYDYKFADSSFSINQLEEMTLNERVWKDKHYTNWNMTYPELQTLFQQKLEKQIKLHESKNIILVTHVVPHSNFIVPTPDHTWSYFNAFLGSPKYGELIKKYSSSIKYAISGHVHFRKTFKIDKTTYINNSLGYRKQWIHSQHVKEEIQNALLTISL
ncbi:metallophosphoesterase [Pontibacillus litoralis]|uniref:Phosphohydrolase n=1 Tax=Pontibacillus litoralis JSM 072002 TaxID=1385512 RepID=A0A0A5G6A4_9BACI|nr:metallophosphoesterase [Pontibacillus litoralis]KGX86620.1 phosphohydrolase [Pontibacillus litoralis JSM 072002]